MPSGKKQRLQSQDDDEGATSLAAIDVDFDGWPELWITATQLVIHEHVNVYRYDRARGKWHLLEYPTGSNVVCRGFAHVSVDRRNRTVNNTCRGDYWWYTDAYRYADKRLYLYRAERSLDWLLEGVNLLLTVENEMAPLKVSSTYDPTGRLLQRVVREGWDAPDNGKPLKALGGQVLPARLPLYSSPHEASTRRYLVKGDRVELLDEADGRVKVRYRSLTRGGCVWLGGVMVNTPRQGVQSHLR